MRVFETLERILSYGIIRPELLRTLSEKILVKLKVLFIHSITGFSSFCLIMFVFKDAREFREYSEAVYCITTLATTTFGLTVLDFKKKKLFKLIDGFKFAMEERSSNLTSRDIYEKGTEFVEKWHEIIYFGLVKLSVPTLVIPCLFASYFLFFSTDLGEKSFLLPFVVWFPYDWRNPLAYPIMLSYLTSVTYYAYMFCAVNVCFPFGICHFLTNFADDIKEEIITLNDCYERLEIKFFKKFQNIIQFHTLVQQLANDFNDLYQFIILNFFFWALSTICNMLLMYQIEFISASPSISALVKISSLAFWGYLSTFMLCISGESVINRYKNIDFYNLCKWYSYPDRCRRMLSIIIMNCQLDVSIQAYGNIKCSRATFEKLSNKGFSFFMLFHQFIN